MAEFKDHTNKIIIREQWCLPILKHLKENLDYKLIYFGLPGIEGLDILTWINYLDYIIAIDCGDYSKEYNFEQAKENIKKLNRLLSRLETEEKISGYSLFHGYIEEVVLKGYDQGGNKFSQDRLVQIYNLDFCNPLTSPLCLSDLKGNINKYYKIEVIRKLLALQLDLCISKRSDRFVMFVTVHSRFWEDEASKHFTNNLNKDFEDYYNYIRSLSKQERNIRLLRFYFFNIIRDQFTSNGFIPEFFPSIYYNGAANSKLICFTIAGTYYQDPSATAPFRQNFKELVNSKFLSPDKKNIVINNANDEEMEVSPDPIEHLVNFQSYRNLWRK